jgi:hypothetical protein
MNRSCRMAAAAAALLALGAGSGNAFANTVHATANSTVTLSGGHVLRVSLRPPNSGSTGYHWRASTVAPKSLLRRTSNRTVRGRQVFTFRAGSPGVTRIRFRYVPPARGAKPVRRIDLTVVVNPRHKRLRCYAPHTRTVLSNTRARVFRMRRSFTLATEFVQRTRYWAYFGCDFRRDRAHPLANLGSNGSINASENNYATVLLRGSVAGYILRKGCLLAFPGCLNAHIPAVVSQDLRTGRVIRRVFVGSAHDEFGNPVPTLLMSANGGLAWMEFEGHDVNSIHRSDHPIVGGNAIAHDNQVLDDGQHGYVDEDSLHAVRGGFTWKRGGTVRRASLL